MAKRGALADIPISILLVDDHEENLLALQVILETPGVTLVKAASGAEALRCVLRDDFAVILLDVAMPGMDGFEVAQLIKQRERTRHIPIIFLTAAIKDVASVYRGYEVGAVDYILKPIDADVVRAKVAVFVELHRRGEEIRRQAELLREAERRQRDADLAELRGANELRYRSLADAVPQLVWTAQPGGAVSYCNQRWLDYTGLTLAQLVGSGWQSVIHPNDVARFGERWGRALAAVEPLRAECRLRSDYGGYAWHLCEALPETDRQGRLVGWLGTFTDVNEQKQLEEERRQALLREQMARAEAEVSLRRFEFLAEASNLLSRSLDTTGILKGLAALATPRLCAWCVVDLVGEGGALEPAAFAHEDEALRPLGGELARHLQPEEDAARGVAGVLRSGRPEVSAQPCDAAQVAAALGTERVDLVARLGAAAYVSVPLCARGQVLGVMTLVAARPERAYASSDVALALDLGQRTALAVDNARLYARAQETVRIREEFLSIASHELRTPLSALELLVQSIQIQLGKEPLDLPRMIAKTAVARRQVDRLARLISEMLDVSRIEAGRLELDLQDVDLGELAREIVGRFAGELERAGNSIELDVAEGLVGFWDRDRLDQVVTNLVHNAIKYGIGKPIRISSRPQGEGADAAATLAVKDHGIGIPAEDQRRIFGRFERAVSSRAYGGMGVGLFIVDRILKAHGGTIEVASEPGAGATFSVTLPLGRAAARTQPPAASEGSERAMGAKIPESPLQP